MRIPARIGGTLLIVLGGVVLLAAIVAMKIVGTTDTISLQPRQITTDGAAITTARGLLGYYDSTLTIRATAADPRQKLWIGIAHQDDLDNYLRDRSRAEILSYAYPDRLRINDIDEADDDLAAPVDLDWWVASAHGTGHAELNWPMRNAAYGAVIMKSDGSRKIAGDVTLGLQLQGAFRTAVWAGVGGLIAVLLGIGSFVLTRRHKESDR